MSSRRSPNLLAPAASATARSLCSMSSRRSEFVQETVAQTPSDTLSAPRPQQLESGAMSDDTPNRQMLASMAPDELRSAMRTLGYRTQSDLAGAIGVSRS